MYPNYSLHCWHQYGEQGSLLHIMWACKSLTSCWNDIFKLLAGGTGKMINPNPNLALLHVGIDAIPLLLSTYAMQQNESLLDYGNHSKYPRWPKQNSIITVTWDGHLPLNNFLYSKCVQTWSLWTHNPNCRVLC